MLTTKSKIFTKVVIWLVAEIVLNFVGLDDLADYSEFIFEKHNSVAVAECTINLILD